MRSTLEAGGADPEAVRPVVVTGRFMCLWLVGRRCGECGDVGLSSYGPCDVRWAHFTVAARRGRSFDVDVQIGSTA